METVMIYIIKNIFIILTLNICFFVHQCNTCATMCCIDGQENKYLVLNECNRMLNYNIFLSYLLHQEKLCFPDVPINFTVKFTNCKELMEMREKNNKNNF
jgi:hypothetical protein